MPRHISLLFPGQGSQSLNMLSTFSSSEINSVSNTVNNALDIDIIDCIKNGPDEILNQTSITQPAILITSYLYYQRFINDTGIVPDIFAGHSLGGVSTHLLSNSGQTRRSKSRLDGENTRIEEAPANTCPH